MFASPEDLLMLQGSGGRPFEEFVFDLVVAEASRHGIPLGSIRWDNRTNVGDGGRDIVVDHSHTDAVRFIPQHRSIWSAKSGVDGTLPTTLRQELIAPGHAGLREDLQQGCPYVWCTLQPTSEDAVTQLKSKAAEVAVAPDGFIFDPKLVEFRPLPVLCSVLNDNPGLIAKHLPSLADAFQGVLNFSEWEAQDRFGFATQFVDFSARSEIVTKIRSHLRGRTSPNLLHLAGLSGIGKTRTVLEACRDQRDLTGVLYVPRYAEFHERFLRHLTRNQNLFALVVIDEVPLEALGRLQSVFEPLSQRIRLVTVGPARRNDRSRPDTNVFVLSEPRTREDVFEVVRNAGEGIGKTVLESIARFAAHDLRLALMLVEATRQDGALCDLPIADGEDVWRRVTSLFGSKLNNLETFQNAYPYLTVAIDVGFARELRHELEAIAAKFAVAPQRFDEAIANAVQCGLGVRSKDFFEPIPRALAGHLFRQRIWGALQPRLGEFLKGLPDRLLRRIVERCQDCAGPEREEIEQALAAFFREALGSTDLTLLVDRSRSRLFKAWTELDPRRGLEWLQLAVERASEEDLASLDGDPDGSGGWRGRRQLVWLCEGLASFGEYFWQCEAILFRLAQFETEPSIGNNSTVIWKGLFLPVLAFTEVPFPERAGHLLSRLGTSAPATVRLTMSAAVDVLAGYFGGRVVPPTIVGGRIAPKPWSPNTRERLRQIQRDFGRRIIEQINRLPGELLEICREIVVEHLHDFTHLGLVADLRTLFDASNSEVKRSVHTQLLHTIEFEERNASAVNAQSDMLSEIKRWEESLRPGDLTERVKALTSRDYWDVTRHEGLRESQSGASPYSRLADELLREPNLVQNLEEWFSSEHARSGFNLGFALGEMDVNEELTSTLSAWLDSGRCRSIVTGYLRGVASRLHVLPSEWSDRLERSAAQHQEFSALVTVDADYSNAGFQRIVRLVRSGSISPRILRYFFRSEWEPIVGPAEQAQVLELLLNLQGQGQLDAIGTALSLAVSWTKYGKEAVSPELAKPVIRLLQESLRVRCDPHEWVCLLESVSKTQPKTAIGLAAEAISTPGPMLVSLQDDVAVCLQDLARDYPGLVMTAIGQRLLDRTNRIYFGIASFQGLFDAIGLSELQRWISENGSEPIRFIARHLTSPSVQDNVPYIPEVTDWILTEFWQDAKVFDEFCAGRHQAEVREGHARDRRPELERSLQLFIAHEKVWVRRWAEYELKENVRDAEIDDELDDRFERM